jgi:methionyl aminopeptidase
VKYTPEEIVKITASGLILAKVKEELVKMVQVGVSAWDLEEKARVLITEAGAKPSFQMVSGYQWATCINVNEGIVHGIPKKETVFRAGDLVSLDLGVYYQGFHTDSSISVANDSTPETLKFLEVGRVAMKQAIAQAVVGNRVWDISAAIEETVASAGYSPVRALVGHGVGRELHEEPQIPCFKAGRRETSPILEKGDCLAIEVMYTMGKPDLVEASDGWTIETADGKISGLFEETVVVDNGEPWVLTGLPEIGNKISHG